MKFIYLLLIIILFSCKKNENLKVEEKKEEIEYSPLSLKLILLNNNLLYDDSTKVDFEILPKNPNTSSYEIEWTSSNESIVKVNKHGMIYGLSKGSVELIAKIKNTNITSKINIYVNPPQPTQILLKLEKDSISFPQTNKMTYEILPKNIKPGDYQVILTPVDKGFLNILEDGTIVPLRAQIKDNPKYTTINAKIANTNITSTTVVKVGHRLTRLELNKEILLPSGIHMLVTNLEKKTRGTSATDYSISYTLINKTKDNVYEATYMDLFSKSGKRYSSSAYFATKIFPGESVNRVNSFTELNNVEMDYWQYYDQDGINSVPFPNNCTDIVKLFL